MKPKSIFTLAACILFFATTSVDGYQILFTPSITISEEYNDNLFLASQNEEDDFITLVTPGFILEVTQRENGLELEYNPGYSLYANNSEFNSWRHDALLSVWVAATRNTKIEFEDAFLFTEDPTLDVDVLSPITEDPLIQGDPTIRRGRESYYNNTATIRMINQFGTDDSFFIEYAYNMLRNDDQEVEDINQHMPAAGISYWFLPRWGIEIEGLLTDNELDESDDFDEWYGRLTQTYRAGRHFQTYIQYEHTEVKYSEHQDESRIDYRVFEPSIGFSYDVMNDLLFVLRLGFFRADPDKGEAVSGPSGDIELTKTLRNGSISITGEAGQDNTVFSAEGLGFTKFYEIEGSAEYRFLRNIIGDISVSYRNAVFEETETDREDDIVEASIGLTYEATSWLSTRLEYFYRTLGSTLPEDEYEENRILFNVTLTKPRPYRWVK